MQLCNFAVVLEMLLYNANGMHYDGNGYGSERQLEMYFSKTKLRFVSVNYSMNK